MGWRAAALDFLMSTYHMPFERAALFPLRTAAVLCAHRNAREGGDIGPDNPAVAAMAAARRRVRAHYRRFFRIVP